ncbi:MAG TPA: DUF4003 family protein [Planctomycetes bacterium]|nr:DUF4003 family protein [Planctomycetota bacterium]HIN80534.1 DUF4003 family protein [Planctomycetota bacterium]
MSHPSTTDLFSRFQEIHEILGKERSWGGMAVPFRCAAIASLRTPGSSEEVGERVVDAAAQIKKEAGLFGDLRSPIRFVLAAQLVLNGDQPGAFLEEVNRVRQMFRDRRLRRGRMYETFAILILRTQGSLHPINEATVDRFQRIYEGMKEHHWWLTGPEDFPAAAILAMKNESSTQIIGRVESIYEALDQKGFRKGDPLQTASHLLYMSPGSPHEVARRCWSLTEAFRREKERIGSTRYDDVATLSFLHRHDPETIVSNVVTNRDQFRALRPKPSSDRAFAFAVGITFLDLVQSDAQLEGLTEVNALLDAQQAIEAAQAAMIAASAGAAAAASSG